MSTYIHFVRNTSAIPLHTVGLPPSQTCILTHTYECLSFLLTVLLAFQLTFPPTYQLTFSPWYCINPPTYYLPSHPTPPPPFVPWHHHHHYYSRIDTGGQNKTPINRSIPKKDTDTDHKSPVCFPKGQQVLLVLCLRVCEGGGRGVLRIGESMR